MQKSIDFPDLSLWGLNVGSLKELSRPWQKFFARLPEINSVQIHEWKHYHLLSYILKRFHEIYGFAYGLSFKGPPLNCEELFFVKKMLAGLGTDSMIKAKEYIDWCFDEKAIKRKMPIQKIGFFLTTGFITEFQRQKKIKETITRNTKLPEKYIKMAEDLNVPVETYGDLKFLTEMLKKAGPPKPENKTYLEYILMLEKLCFDFNLLNAF